MCVDEDDDEDAISTWMWTAGGTDPAESCEILQDIVDDTPENLLSSLLSKLTKDNDPLMDVPINRWQATDALCAALDRLNPSDKEMKILAERFPVRWRVCAMFGEPFGVYVLLNGAVLVRNLHRVLGPDLAEGRLLVMDATVAECLAADLDMLRARNSDRPTCFLLTHDERGVRLLSSSEAVDLRASGWGQTIAVCSLRPEDVDDARSPLRTRALREAGLKARSLIVFLRFFGDRADVIPACRFDDDLDVFLEEMGESFPDNLLESGWVESAPLEGDALIGRIAGRMEDEAELVGDGAGATWMRDYALPLAAARLADEMDRETENFGFSPDPNGPRWSRSLPSPVSEILANDPEILRKSITLQLLISHEKTYRHVRDGYLLEIIKNSFQIDCEQNVRVQVSGYIDWDRTRKEGLATLRHVDELARSLDDAVAAIARHAEEPNEDLDNAIMHTGLKVVFLVAFPEGRPWDPVIARAASSLSRTINETVGVFINGRGEYLAYRNGEPDGGDHELYQLEAPV